MKPSEQRISSLSLRPHHSPASHVCVFKALPHRRLSGRTDWPGASAHTSQDYRLGWTWRPVLATLQGRCQTPHWGAPSPPERPPGKTVQQTGGLQCFLWVRSTVSSDGNTHTRTMNRGAKTSPPAGQTVCPTSNLERPAFSPQQAHCSFLAILTTAPSLSLLPDLTRDSQEQMLSFSMTFFQTGFRIDEFPRRS